MIERKSGAQNYLMDLIEPLHVCQDHPVFPLSYAVADQVRKCLITATPRILVDACLPFVSEVARIDPKDLHIYGGRRISNGE